MAPGRKTRIEGLQCIGDPACPLPIKARGMCVNHYRAWYKANPEEVSPHAKWGDDLLARLQSRTIYRDCGCWELDMAPSPFHVSLRFHGKRTAAHRLSYEMFVGPIPDRFHLDHMCENPRCWKPLHLEPVPLRINVLRGWGHPAVNHLKTTDCVCWDRRPATCPLHGQLHWRPDWQGCIVDLRAGGLLKEAA